jgi:putative transposase
MLWFALYRVFSLLLDMLCLSRFSVNDKDLEVLVLCQQLHFVRRKQKRGPHMSMLDKFFLVTLVSRLNGSSCSAREQLEQPILLFKPETVLRWHRQLVKCKWTFRTLHPNGGRPPTDHSIEALVLQLARENDWGGGKIEWELRKLEHRITERTILNILKRHEIPPQPSRNSNPTQ